MVGSKLFRLNLLLIGIFFCGCQPAEPVLSSVNAAPQLNGQEIVYVQNEQIYLYLSASQANLALTQSGSNSAPLLSPDQQSILYLSREDLYTKFWQYNLITQQANLITATKSQPNFISLSPTGNFLLYLDQGDLFLLDLGQGLSERVDSVVTYPAWSPHGDEFIYLKDGHQLFRVNFASLAEREATEIINRPLQAPRYLTKQTLLFAQATAEGYDLISYNIFNQTTLILLSLPNSITQAQLLLSPQKDKAVFSFIDNPESLQRVNWLINLTTNESRTIVPAGFDLFWGGTDQVLYYHYNEVEAAGGLARNLYRFQLDRRKKELIINQAAAAVFANQLESNTNYY